jgi:hypothetical protein
LFKPHPFCLTDVLTVVARANLAAGLALTVVPVAQGVALAAAFKSYYKARCGGIADDRAETVFCATPGLKVVAIVTFGGAGDVFNLAGTWM